MNTCHEATATVVAAAENMAAADGYVARNVNWTEVHWHYGVRILMNAAYYRACAERGDCAEMLPAWMECEARMRAKFEGRTDIAS